MLFQGQRYMLTQNTSNSAKSGRALLNTSEFHVYLFDGDKKTERVFILQSVPNST